MISNWFGDHYIELLGVITSLIYLYFSVRQIIWLWPFGIISSALFIWIFFSSKFYADMGLQVYYLGISAYGWYYWAGGNKDENTAVPVSRLSGSLAGVLSGTGLILFFGIVAILKFLTDSDVPWGDGFTTAASIIATWMLARKILEHWLLWIIIDAFAAGLYFYKGLYPSSVLYVIYAIIAVLGYRQWKKDLSG
jgi:nicotinamide mononucleotide transporter